MSLKKVKVLGVSVTTSSKETILEYLEKYFRKSGKGKRKKGKTKIKPLVVVTPNPEQIVYAQSDPYFAEVLNRADIAIPDGIGIVIAQRFLNFKFQTSNFKLKIERIPGVEFMEDLVRLVAERGYPIGLIGGRGRVALDTLECLKRTYPGLTGWAQEPGEITVESTNLQTDKSTNKLQMDEYVAEMLEKIKQTGTRLVFVGLGAPKQELFSALLARQCQMSNPPAGEAGFKFQILIMSVGGAFDIIAGRTPRAPAILRTLGLEWLWRLARQPWRWRRQLALLTFLWFVLREKRA